MLTGVPAVFFPFVALAYPIGFAFVLYAHDKPDKLRLGLAAFAVAVSVAALACVVQASIEDPWIMLKIFSFAQVSEQLRSPWLVLASVLHFALGDVAILTIVVYVWCTRLHRSVWSLLLYVPTMLWCNVVGILPWLLTPAVARFALDGSVLPAIPPAHRGRTHSR